jgi:hypothetical protein
MPVVTTVKWRTAGLTGLVGRRWETRNAEASEVWWGCLLEEWEGWFSTFPVSPTLCLLISLSGTADHLPSQHFWYHRHLPKFAFFIISYSPMWNSSVLKKAKTYSNTS